MPLRKDESAGDARQRLSLRVLYTLNTSPQYLLARTRHRIEVVPLLEDESNMSAPCGSERGSVIAKQRYAKVSLKTCLGVVCNASPELVCDRSRDYSVYVVDPLELPPSDDNAVHGSARLPIDASSGNSAPCPWGEGVSIGMGLMSWCLAENMIPSPGSENDVDEGYVVGKVVRDRGTDALEIIMSLRETATQTQHQHALSLSSWGLLAPSTVPVNSGTSSPDAQISPPFPTSQNSVLAPVTSQPSSVAENLEGDSLAEIKDVTSQACPSSAPGSSSPSRPPDNRPARAKTKKIGRPQGAKTHPEKRARQLAIQMHKEKLERLLNIVKMQNGEEYDKTLIIASECETKVTEEIIAREQRLLEELQSRPLIVDGPRYTTRPLPRRATSPTTHSPLVQTIAPKQKRRAATQGNAVASGSNRTRNETAEDGPSSVESTQGVTNVNRGTDFLSLLSSVLGKVDEAPIIDPAAGAGPCRGTEKGKEKQSFPFVNDALANALQKLLPYLPNPTPQPNMHPINTPSEPLSNTKIDVTCHPHISANDPQARSEHIFPATYPGNLYPRLFKTADESFYYPERGPNRPYDKQWGTRSSASLEAETPQVSDGVNPVPGGGWARGKKILPRATAPTQLETASYDGNTAGSDAGARPSATTTMAAPDKENMPPAKSKRGLKRALSSSADAKESVNSTDTLSSKKSVKKRKQEEVAGSARSKITHRAMMGSAENNKATSRAQATFPVSSPVRSRTLTRSPRSLPVMAVSEPDPLLPRPSITPLNNNRPSNEFARQLTAPSLSRNSTNGPPMTPPRDRLLDDEAGESLFTPCVPISASRLPDAGPGRKSTPSSPCPISAKSFSHVADLRERQSSGLGEVECGHGAMLSSRHVGTGWDLPPSSPPPPTSPILPDNDVISEENQMGWDLGMNGLDVEMEKSCTERRFEDHGITINSAGTSTPAAGIHVLDSDGPSDQLSTLEATVPFDASSDGAFSELGRFDERKQVDDSDGIGLDIDELWSSLGPVIAHAQLDVSVDEFGFYGLANDQTLVVPEEQGAVDPIRLADDLKALFGGCVV